MKHKKTLTRILSLILVLTLVLGITPPIAASAEESTWKIQVDTEIFWVKTETSEKNYETLKKQVQLFSSELAEKVTKTALPISYGEDTDAGSSDVLLVLDEALEIAEQGYVVQIEGSTVKVSASDADGLFYGCRYIIQQLLINGSVSGAQEAPDVLERALSLDNGRKYYSVEWIKEMIREMSWANMNALVLHFSEEMGLGIESKIYPWLAGRDGKLCTQADITAENTYLTQEDVKDIVEYAKIYHVEIIPSFDSPGHMNYIVKLFNEQCADEDYSFTYDGKIYTAKAGSEIGNYFHYNGETSIVKGSRNTNYSRGIDISNEVAVAFTRSLIEEYATLFNELGCTKFDIGGDELLGWGSAINNSVSKWKQLDHWKEYAQNRAKEEGKTNYANAVAYDGFMYYMNDLYDLVTELGYASVRMWNDDALRSSDTGWRKVVELNKNVDIWFWTTGSNTVWTYETAGYQVYNILSDYNYYAMTNDYFSDSRSSFTQCYADEIYNEWTPFTFDPNSTVLETGKNTAIGNPNVLGGAFAIWSDNPTLKTKDEVMSDVLPLLRANGAKSWDALANESVDYDTYTSNLSKIGDAPVGNVKASDIYTGADLTALEATVSEYNNYQAADYTADSFAAYTSAVDSGKALLAAEKPLQKDVDAAVEAINDAKNALKEAEEAEIGTVECLVQGSFKTSKVYVGKVATLSVSTKKNVEVTSMEVYDDLGKLIDFVRYNQNTKKADRNIHTMIFKVSAEDVGPREYTVRAILADGTRSVDSMTFSILVK